MRNSQFPCSPTAGLIVLIKEDTWLLLEIVSPWCNAFCANHCTNPHAMRIYLLFVLFMVLQGLDSRTNPFQEGEDDNNMDSMDRVKSIRGA